MPSIRVTSRCGFAFVELLVVVTTLAIVVGAGVFVFEELTTSPIDRTCSKQATEFGNEVRAFAANNRYLPGTRGKDPTGWSVFSAALDLYRNGEAAGPPSLTRYGKRADQWTYNAKSGIVTLGPSCT
jgi:hypothetical protein